MTYSTLKSLLTETALFTDNEVAEIVKTCGKASVGCSIIACELAGIKLHGNDTDVIIDTANEFLTDPTKEG